MQRLMQRKSSYSTRRFLGCEIAKAVGVSLQYIFSCETSDIDLDSEDPLFYPKVKSPINYIRQGANSEDLIRSAPRAWELLVGRGGEIKKLSDRRGYKILWDIYARFSLINKYHVAIS